MDRSNCPPTYIAVGRAPRGSVGIIKDLPNSALKTFLTNPSLAEVNNFKGVQDYLREIQGAQISYMKWLKENRDLSLTLNMNPYMNETIIKQRMRDLCEIREIGDGVFESKCNPESLLEVKISSPDMVVMQQAQASVILYSTLFLTSYSVDGLEELLKELNENRDASYESKLEIGRRSRVGKLRNDHTLAIVGELGSDALAAVRWVMNNQNSFCPNGKAKKARSGHLAENGMCTNSDTEMILKYVEARLTGPVEESVQVDGRTEKIAVNYSVVYKKPIQDLKTLIPLRVDECQRGIDYADNTFGGIIPNGDFRRVMSSPDCPRLPTSY